MQPPRTLKQLSIINYPFYNPVTKIKFDILSNIKGQTSDVKLTIFNILEKEVSAIVNEHLSYGSYEADFDGNNLSSGVYFYKLAVDRNHIDTKRMMLLRDVRREMQDVYFVL